MSEKTCKTPARTAGNITITDAVHYCPQTGKLTWLVSYGPIRAGYPCGYKAANGYVCFSFRGKAHYAHRYAFYVQTGEWPASEVDHINHDKTDNRFCNLRLATRTQNSANTRHVNSTGFKGVWRDKRLFSARISLGGKRRFLGLYETPEEAAHAYDAAAIAIAGPYAKLNFPEHTPKEPSDDARAEKEPT